MPFKTNYKLFTNYISTTKLEKLTKTPSFSLKYHIISNIIYCYKQNCIHLYISILTTLIMRIYYQKI